MKPITVRRFRMRLAYHVRNLDNAKARLVAVAGTVFGQLHQRAVHDADVGYAPVKYPGTFLGISAELFKGLSEILHTQREQEKSLAMLGQKASRDRLGIVWAYEDQPTFADPCSRRTSPPKRVINDDKRINAQCALEVCRRLRKIADNEIDMVNSLRRHYRDGNIPALGSRAGTLRPSSCSSQ